MQLVNALAETSASKHIILDSLRGTRQEPKGSSLDILRPLAAHNTRISFFRTPNSHGKIKQFVPARLNELFGVFHAKIYLFDDNVLISGGNLSDSYFTQRQDRYILVKDCKSLADYYEGVFHLLGDFSFEYQGNETFASPQFNPLEDPDRFSNTLKERINHIIVPEQIKEHPSTKDNALIFPTFQLGSIGLTHDMDVLSHVLSNLPDTAYVDMATAYFNLVPPLLDIVHKSAFKWRILTASPKVSLSFSCQFSLV